MSHRLSDAVVRATTAAIAYLAQHTGRLLLLLLFSYVHRGEFNCKALKSLMVAVERALPQAKRQALSREHRQQMVQTQRATRRQRRSQGSCSNGLACSDYFTDVFAAVVEEEGEEMCPSFADLPKQCMETIFSTLDPISLATAVCVCTTWRQLAISDELWRPLRDLTFGAEASAELPENVTVTASAYESFSLLAHEHSECLLPWRSGKRVCCHGAVRVIAPQTWERILAAPGPAGIAWNKSIGVAFMTPTEVVVWLDRRDGKVLEQVNSQWKHREAARLRARTKQTRHRRGQPGADGGE